MLVKKLYLSLVYLSISIGIALEISGSNWDIIWHALRHVESFFTPPHSIIYSGVVLAIGSLVIGVIIQAGMLHQKSRNRLMRQQTVLSLSSMLLLVKTKIIMIIPLSLKLAGIGVILQLTAGLFDFWWHNHFGFDGLLSPPHSILATGMLMASLGALVGLYRITKYGNDTLFANTNNINNKINLSTGSLSLLAIPFSVSWMVSVGIIFMFTLPFSKGQYFDFNPNPIAAIIANAILIPFVTAGIFYVISLTVIVYDNDRTCSNTRILTGKRTVKYSCFIFTITTACVMVMQLTTTIISNPYFIGNLDLYLLNILPAIMCDILLLKYRPKVSYNNNEDSYNTVIISSNKNRYKLNKCQLSIISSLFHNRKCIALIVSTIISVFYVTLFYPWSFDLYKHYFFGLNENLVVKKIDAFQRLLWTLILPIIVPTSIITSIMAGLIIDKVMMQLAVDKNNNIHKNI